VAEHYCRIFTDVYGLKTVSLRYFTVFGPRMHPDLAMKKGSGEYNIGSGKRVTLP